MDQLIAKAQQLQARVRSGEITDPTADQVAILGFGFVTHLDMMDPGIDSLMQTREPAGCCATTAQSLPRRFTASLSL